MAKHIGEMIVEARTKKGLSQGALAEKVGMTQAAVCQVETGRNRNPNFLKVVRIAHALKIDANALHKTALAYAAKHA